MLILYLSTMHPKQLLPIIIMALISCRPDARVSEEDSAETAIEQADTNQSSIDTVQLDPNLTPRWAAFEQHKRVDLSKYDKLKGQERLDMMEKVKDDFDFAYYDGEWQHDAEKYFHFMDLDADGDLDLIYNGFSRGEPLIVWIYLNVEGEFKPEFQTQQHITYIEYGEEGLTALTIYNPGCCTDYLVYNTEWLIEHEKDNLIFDEKKHTGEIAHTTLPDYIFKTPKQFKTLQDEYYLRMDPFIDTVDVMFDGATFKQNIVCIYPADSRGVALGQTTDSTGRVWWYVEMDYNTPPDYSEIPDYEIYAITMKGWMSSRFLEVVE
ncbi:hypothetical protein K6119_15835 [Paracrocinitomix mangrovi]|uniref:hypothetical protein n=1 Tax=Paracrocinitomix mangrovi TaxID=2862509 RepID=UPI001EDC591D|nr:hypothetical protein [Paracrocinitomix mangrovi]UKN01201.1 hypothetical protein K6119_15835 [Paracrocinitomix mangrovi]